MALPSFYLSPDDPEEERRIFDLIDPDQVPQASDTGYADHEEELMASDDYGDRQEQHDESSDNGIERIKDLSPENRAKVEELIDRLLDEKGQ